MSRDIELIKPSSEFKAQANINTEKYNELLKSFKNNSDDFWAELARSELDWFEDFYKVLNKDNPPFYKWFDGGKLNISYNCLDRHLKDKADKTALIFEGEPGDSRSYSYKELHREVSKAANMLKELNIKKGDVVCIYMPLCPESVIAMQACTRIGAIHSVVFAGFSSHALRERIIDGRAKLIITADGLNRKGAVVPLLSCVEEAARGIDSIENIVSFKRINDASLKSSDPRVLDWTKLMAKQSPDCAAEAMASSDTSFILYTSGSTGKPKGIQHATAGYLLWTHLTSKWVFDLKDNDIFWCTADIGWITGHSYITYGPLSNGATCFIYEGAPNYPAEDRFWQLIDKYKISIFYTAPTAIRSFIQWGLKHLDAYSLESLRLLGTVGEPINPEVWMWFYKHIGKERCPIVDTWWQTETGGHMITTLPGVHAMKPGSAGLPLPGINADINEEGLLHIKSPWPSMLRTVWGNDERYIAAYWSSIDNAYTVGDAATKDDKSYITISGRTDDVINISGHRLGTAEVESALVTHELISEAAVVAVPHELKGEGIIAYVTLITEKLEKLKATLNEEELENSFKDTVVKEIGKIAKPEKVVVCSALPKTRSGKIMRRLLKDIAQGKKPAGDISTLENQQVIDDLN